MLTRDSEYAVLLDACVLAPMPLADTLLRLAEEPAFYRPLWSQPLLQEVGSVLQKFGNTPAQIERRLQFMRDYFPEALVEIPDGLEAAFTGVPDPDDRHVLAAAVRGHANAIITFNKRHFPEECLKQYDILRQTPDEFLIHQFHLSPDLLLDKIEAQAIAIKQNRGQVVARLATLCQAPEFAKVVGKRT